MPSLADVQARMRHAVVDGGDVATELAATLDRPSRFAIHQRNYHASLTKAIVERFPATVWLLGSELVTTAAEQFVRQRPPSRPCIAEYGEAFPAWLASLPALATFTYVGEFATLEWHLGRVAHEVDLAPDGPAFHHQRLEQSVDALIQVFLSDDAPERFVLEDGPFWLEVRGHRGELQMQRLSEADFALRAYARRRTP
jgi:hypothetical protein